MIQRAFTFRFVIPWGLEPQSKEPESFILSIELRNRFKRYKSSKIKRKKEDFVLLFYLN